MSTNIQRLVGVAALGGALSLNGCSAASGGTASAASTAVVGAQPGAGVERDRDGVELARDGWENLLPPADLHGFRRVPLDPLANKPVWQVRADGSLFIDGTGAKEMLLSERALSDGTLHVEWRFVAPSAAAPAGGGSGSAASVPAAPASAAPVYNGGVYVRTPLDGKSWVQLQVSHADAPPVVGDLIAQIPGRAERVDVFQTQPSAAAPIGEWNTYDITLRGPTVELAVNGKPAAAWASCPFLTGHVGLQAEGSSIEVRAFRYRPL